MEDLKNNNPLPNRYTDEIDLMDLVMVLWRRRWVLIGVAVLFTGLGIAAALLKPPAYQYQAVVEIGSYLVGQNIRSIDSTDNVVNKLKDAYIPKAVAQVASSDESIDKLEIDVSASKGTSIVTVSAKAARAESGPYVEAMGAALAGLLEDSGRIVSVERKRLQLERNSEEAKLDEMQRQIVINQAELTRLNQRIKETQGHIERIQAQLYGDNELVDEARRDVRNEPSAMTMLLIDDSRRSGLQWLNSLEDRLAGIQSKYDEIKAKIAGLEQSKALKAQEIELIKVREQNMLETRVVYGPAASLEPVGLYGIKLVAIAGFLGLFLGLFAAFIAEFIAKARERLKAPATA